MTFKHLSLVFSFFLIIIFGQSLLAVEFTGNARNDFFPEACVDDPNGQNIALPASFPVGTVSGFDIAAICLLYDPTDDRLDAGVVTFDDPATGLPVPFGDADGDGDPAGTSAALSDEDGEDKADLSDGEYFALIIDLDDDAATPPDVVAGVSSNRSAPNGFRVSEVDLPHLGFDLAFSTSYYGSLIAGSDESPLFASPDSLNPHLEFSINGFSELPGASALDLSDPNDTLSFIFRAGSLADTIIGDEDVRIVSRAVADFADDDGDGLPDAVDPADEGEEEEPEVADAQETPEVPEDDGGDGDVEEDSDGETPVATGTGVDVRAQGGGCSLQVPAK